MSISIEKGRKLVRLARNVIEAFLSGKENLDVKVEPWMEESRGVFTTLYTYPNHELRGCIGIPYPTDSLHKNLIESAKSATMDPRFPPLEKDELDHIIIEVSVLTKPEEIKFSDWKDLLKKIIPKKDGLILVHPYGSGLFLPQVWDEIPNKEDFLDNLCLKAGLPSGCWKGNVRIFKFHVEAFKEKKPRGEVIKLS